MHICKENFCQIERAYDYRLAGRNELEYPIILIE